MDPVTSAATTETVVDLAPAPVSDKRLLANRLKTQPPAPTPRSPADLLAHFVRTAAANDVDVLGTLHRYETATQRALAQAMDQYQRLHDASTATDPADAESTSTDLHHHFHYHHHAETQRVGQPPAAPPREGEAPSEPSPEVARASRPWTDPQTEPAAPPDPRPPQCDPPAPPNPTPSPPHSVTPSLPLPPPPTVRNFQTNPTHPPFPPARPLQQS